MTADLIVLIVVVSILAAVLFGVLLVLVWTSFKDHYEFSDVHDEPENEQ